MLQPQFFSIVVIVLICSASRIYPSQQQPTPTLGCSHVNTTFSSIWLIWHWKRPRLAPRIKKYSIYPSPLDCATTVSFWI